MKNKTQIKLLAISGGPDSIFLLNMCLGDDIVVAHVNYNQRFNSDIDEKIVKEMCEKHNIPLEILNLKASDYQGGNFQSWARDKRYSFFKRIYQKYNCNSLLIAHHIDDFLETYYLQKKRKSFINYYGIKKVNFIYGMRVERPFLFKYTKKQILKFLNQNQIPFATDYTNEQPKYSRNKIRLKIKNKPHLFKKAKALQIRLKNIWKNFQNQRILRLLIMWEEKGLSQDFLVKIKKRDQIKLLYVFLNKQYDHINLTKGKLNLILDFIISKNRTSKFKISEGLYLYKIKGKLKQNNI